MRVHHLNCISSCPLGGALMDYRSWTALRARLTCHCLLVETDRELVLVDTGFGLRDVESPESRLSRAFLALLKPDFRAEMTAVRQIAALGFDARDVRHIVLSHLDFDHAGGLDDFPGATVHLLASERGAAMAQKTMLDRMRFRPQQWSTQPHWRAYEQTAGERWFGLDGAQQLDGLPPEILLVPLIGHTLGHAGVAIRRPHDWLFYAGDAYFHHGEMQGNGKAYCPPGLRFYQWMMEKDRAARLTNQERLRELLVAYDGKLTLFCAHDPVEFERMAGRGEHAPISPGFNRASHPTKVTRPPGGGVASA